MSDSDSDNLAQNNLFTMPNESTMFRIKGPQFDSTMRMNAHSTALNLPHNFERQGYREQHMHRSIYDRRATSPMSQMSFPVEPPRNFQHSYYPSGYAHSSTGRGRAGSPMSVRSIGSNMSVTADSIVSALKNTKFNKYELRNIREAYNKLMKGYSRKRIAKKRNLKHFLKGARRKSGGLSGEEGSDSSISSDDCRSTRTGITMHQGYRQHAPSLIYPVSGRISDDAISTKTDLTHLRRAIQDSSIYRDCTNNIKQNSFKNMFSLENKFRNQKSQNNTLLGLPKPPSMPQKNRFQNSFLLPSQRFNKSSAVTTICEDITSKRPTIPIAKNRGLNCMDHVQQTNNQSKSDEDEEIFNEVTVLEKSVCQNKTSKEPERQRKRNYYSSCSDTDSSCSEPKRTKLLDSAKNVVISEKERTQKVTHKDKVQKQNKVTKNTKEDFVFAKPQFPLRVSTQSKNNDKPTKSLQVNTKENIEKPKQKSGTNTLLENIENIEKPKQKSGTNTLLEPVLSKEPIPADNLSDNFQSTSDVSQRPSFMKRKLFTQTLDVTESRNLSNDSVSCSPRSTTYNEPKEKSRTRKLACSSYLSRDVLNENNNDYLDLIHKIVDPNQKNEIANHTSQKVESTRLHEPNETNNNNGKDWDITSILSTCNNDNASDTYTDDEIFNMHKEDFHVKKKAPVKKITKELITKECVVKIVKEIEKPKATTVQVKKTPVNKPQRPKNMFSYANTFWNCESESDCAATPIRQSVRKIVDIDSSKKKNQKATTEKLAWNNTVIEKNPSTTNKKQTVEIAQKKVQNSNKQMVSKRNEDSFQKSKCKKGSQELLVGANGKTSKAHNKNEESNHVKTIPEKASTKVSKTKLEETSNKTSKTIVNAKKKQNLQTAALKLNLGESLIDTVKTRRRSGRLTSALNSDSSMTYTPKKVIATKKKTPIKQGNKTAAKVLEKNNKKDTIKKKNAAESNENTGNSKAACKNTKSTRNPDKLVTTTLSPIRVSKRLSGKRETSQSDAYGSNQSMATRSRDKTTRTVADRSLSRNQVKASDKENHNPNTKKSTQAKLNRSQNRNKGKVTEENTTSKGVAVKAKQTHDQTVNKLINLTQLPKPGSREIINLYRSMNCGNIDKKKEKMSDSKRSKGGKVTDASNWGMGLFKGTIGIIPRHCRTEEPYDNDRTIGDDAASITIRSVASNSILTRSRRAKFLHVH